MIEGTQFQLNQETIGIIKYKENSLYRREGDNLIGKFLYDRKYQGYQAQLPFICQNIQLPQIPLEEGQWMFKGYGFYNEQTGKRGDYIYSIYFQ